MEIIKPIHAKILKDLICDGRKKFSDIAKETKLSIDIISKHFNKMKKEGLIVGSTINFDYKSFGYNLVGSIIVWLHPTTKNSDYIIRTINKIPNIYGAGLEEKNKINVVATLTDISELNSLIEKIKDFPEVAGTETKIWTGIKNIPENLSVLSPQKPVVKKQKKPQKINIKPKKLHKLDKLDRDIMEKLSTNGRQPFNKIAIELGFSVTTVIKRYNKMKKNNQIRVVLQINPKKFGYKALLWVDFNSAAQIPRTKLIEEIIKIPNITNLRQTCGNSDYTLVALVKDIEDVLSINSKLESMPEIAKHTYKVKQLPQSFPGPRLQISNM